LERGLAGDFLKLSPVGIAGADNLSE
jgi:hypothetical protein